MDRILIIGITAALGLAACGDRATERDADARGAALAYPAVEASASAASGEERPVVYVDVRRPDEWAAGRVEGAIHIPHTEMAARWTELEKHRDSDIVLYCRTGRRSGIAEEILRQAGFEHLQNGGGLRDLERRGVPVER